MKSALRQRISRTFLNYRWLPHLLFWVLFCLATVNSTVKKGYFDHPELSNHFPVFAIFIFLAVYFVQAYFLILVIMPLYKKGKIHLFWLSLTAAISFFYVICVLLIKWVAMQAPMINQRPEFNLKAMFGENVMLHLIISSVFLAFYYFIDIYDQQKEVQRLEHYKTRKIALESSFLKSQINPHFLFNTLNNIYALSLKKSTETPVIIERLESLLHYMLYECKADLVPLENEFTFTNSYIALEKLRHKADQCTITVNINGDPSGHLVAPLLLINFLENAFKHGTKTSFGKSWIDMDILISKKDFQFKLKNSKPINIVSQPITEYRGGIGLKNVKRRLEILYPRRHKLTIHNAKDHFEVDLIISF